MIDEETANEGTRVLGSAICALLQDALANASGLPRNGFQRRMRFSGLAGVGHDLSALASAAEVLLKRSMLDRERA